MRMLDFLSRRGRLANRARAESGWHAAELWQQLVDQLDAGRPGDRRLLGEALTALGDIAKGQGKRDEAQEWYDRTTQLGACSTNDSQSQATYTARERVTEEELRHRLALAADPRNIASLCNLGAFLQKTARAEEAERLYRQALTMEPSHVSILNNLGALLMQSNQLEEAKEYYQRALAIDPNHVSSLNNFGLLLKALGQPMEAEHHFRQALAINPKDVSALNNLGALFKDLGQPTEAEHNFRQALALDPNHVDTLCNYGLLLTDSGRPTEGESHYRRALAINPKHVSTLCNLGTVLKDLGQPGVAEHHFRQALAIDPNHVNTLCNYGLLLNDSGRPTEAEQHYRRALDINPNHAPTLCNLGTLLSDLGQLAEAEQHLRQALAISPNQVNILCNLGKTLHDAGQLPEAELHYYQALSLDSADIATLFNLGLLLADRGQLTEAEQRYQQVLSINPNHVDALCNLGSLYKDRGQSAEAEQHYRQAVEIDPRHIAALCNLGSLLFNRGQPREAEPHYRQVLHINPNQVDALYFLGILLAHTNRPVEAEQCYRRALTVDPKHIQAYCNLGVLLSNRGHLAEAEQCHRRVLRINPDYTLSLLNLGVLLMETGRLAEAANYFRHGLVQADHTGNQQAWFMGLQQLSRSVIGTWTVPGFALFHADLLLDLGFAPRLEGEIDAIWARIEDMGRHEALTPLTSATLAAAWRDMALWRAGLARGECEHEARSLHLTDERTRHAAAEMAWLAQDADLAELAQAGWAPFPEAILSDSGHFSELTVTHLSEVAWEIVLTLEMNQAVGQKVALELFSADEVLLERADPELLAEFRRIRGAIMGLHRQLATGDEPPEGTVSRVATRIELDTIYSKIARKVPGAALRPTLWRDDLAEALYKYSHRQPVVWLTAAKAGGVAVVLRDGEAGMLRLPGLTRSSAAEWVARLMAVRNLPLADYRSALDTVLTALAPWMWRAAMGGLAEPLAGAAEAVIIPCGQLAALPWAAAHDGRTWWIERDDLPALRFAACAEAAMAAPDAMGTEAADALALFAEPGSELAGLRTLWPDRLRLALSRDELLAAWRQPHHLVHLRCHGTADTEAPMESTLFLADGELTLRDLMRARHQDGAARQRLVTLASCETAFAGTELPEEPQSFAATLLEAGAGAVVAPLLPVEAEATSTLMAALHGYYAGGRSPAHALRLAQLAVLATSAAATSDPLRSPNPGPGTARRRTVPATPPGPSAWALMQVYGG